MAITGIAKIVDNIESGKNLVSIHNPLSFIVEVTYSGATPPDQLYVTESINNNVYTCIPYADVSSTKRQFLFISDEIIRGMMSDFDDEIQVGDTLVSLANKLTKQLTLIFYDPSVTLPATEGVSMLTVNLIVAHASRQFGENPCLTPLYDNEMEKYIGVIDNQCYFYFFNNNASNIITVEVITGELPIYTPVKYGRLYNSYAFLDVRNIAPVGWHIPTYAEMITLLGYVGYATPGLKLKEIGTDHWLSDSGSLNSYGFTARGNGARVTSPYAGGYFTLLKEWSFSYYKTGIAPYYNSFGFYHNQPGMYISTSLSIGAGFGIRCVKDDSTNTGSVTDIDGNVYNTVTIGSQVWMASNLIVTKYRNGDAIPEVTDGIDWYNLTTGAWCAYDNDHNNI